MLLYNHKQEFIGIDDEGLRLLNYGSLEELLNVCTDVADLFANEPGYIHNFKNFGWIDFLLHADSDASSAIVHGNGRTFSCRLSVTPFHLCAHPAQSGYSIEMLQVKNISGEAFKPHAITPKTPPQEIAPPSEPVVESVPTTPLPDYTHLTPTQLSEPGIFDIPKIQPTSLDETHDIYASVAAPLSEKELEAFPEGLLEEVTQAISEPIPAPVSAAQPPVAARTQYTSDEQKYLDHHKIGDSYEYDPHVAANELGLPVDLIEEFIGDFIQQSHEFKNELFEATAKNDFNTLHILSHKLKGVAANLRVENALETLTVINSSTEPAEIGANLKYYYAIIAKLEGKEAPLSPASPSIEKTSPAATEENKSSTPIALEDFDDIYTFSLKQNEDEPLLVHQEEIYTADEIAADMPEQNIPFEKEFLEVEAEVTENTPSEEVPIADTEDVGESITVSLHYDLNSVAGALGIEPAFMEELLHDYKKDALAMSNTIIEAIKAFDTHTWRSGAAKLKGISDNLRLSEISEELAILSKTNDAQEAKKASARLISYLDQL